MFIGAGPLATTGANGDFHAKEYHSSTRGENEKGHPGVVGASQQEAGEKAPSVAAAGGNQVRSLPQGMRFLGTPLQWGGRGDYTTNVNGNQSPADSKRLSPMSS